MSPLNNKDLASYLDKDHVPKLDNNDILSHLGKGLMSYLDKNRMPLLGNKDI